MSFTDKSADEMSGNYTREESPVGAVYVPLHGVIIEEGARIRYERRPWIEGFELDGIRPAEVCCIWSPKPAAEA